MSGYWTNRGLLKRWPSAPDKGIENEFLFGLEYFFVTANERVHLALRKFLLDASQIVPNSGGKIIMKNHADQFVLDTEPDLSHDQITAYACFSHSEGLFFHEKMWENTRLMKHGGARLRINDWVFLGLLNRNIFCWLLSWVTCTAFMMGSFVLYLDVRVYDQVKTYEPKYKAFIEGQREKHWLFKVFIKDSGPMLWWVRMETLLRGNYALGKWVEFLFNILVKINFKNRDGLIKWYFEHDDEHPTAIALNGNIEENNNQGQGDINGEQGQARIEIGP